MLRSRQLARTVRAGLARIQPADVILPTATHGEIRLRLAARGLPTIALIAGSNRICNVNFSEDI
jgi:hypothetical protein